MIEEKRPESAPVCVGLILDGNRRWAKARGLPQLEGHRRGFETFKTIALHAEARGVRHLVAYIFSTENWDRSAEEISYLQELSRELAKGALDELIKKNIRIRFIGQRGRFAAALEDQIEEETADNTGMTVWLCLSYGGRAEIVEAAEKLRQSGTEVTEETLRKNMWSAEMPDPDLVIRTGGQQRLSGFLTWQSVYSELFFVDTYWPDFSPAELDRILAEFAERERRHGK